MQALPSRHPELEQISHRLPWAVAMAHSRTFVTTVNGHLMHVLVPSIDMANHSAEPNALVKSVPCFLWQSCCRCYYSPRTALLLPLQPSCLTASSAGRGSS